VNRVMNLRLPGKAGISSLAEQLFVSQGLCFTHLFSYAT
jgi:hypothetical protein